MKDRKNIRIGKLYKKLLLKYGNPGGQWELWCKRPKTLLEKEEVIIGAILTQRTNWKNVQLAITNLKKARKCSLADIYFLGKKKRKKLANLVKPSGFYKTKIRYLFEIAKFFVKNRKIKKIEKFSPEDLRKTLLNILGIGEETADSILLYALEKPFFVIDEYTRLFVKKHNLSKKLSYEHLQNIFQKNLPKSLKIYQDFHALIVLEGKKWKKVF